MIIAATVFGIATLGVVLYWSTNKGRIKIEVNDPDVVVTIDDGERFSVEGLGEPILLSVGDHELRVKRGDLVVKTRSFSIRRGENETLRVEFEPREPGMVGGMMGGGQESKDSPRMGGMMGMMGGGQESKDLPRMGGMGGMMGGGQESKDSPRMGGMMGIMGGGQESKGSPPMGGMMGMGGGQESKDSPRMGGMMGMMGGGQESKGSPPMGGMMGMMRGGMKRGPAEAPIKLVEGQFVPLFNGKGLSGWSDVLPNGSLWEVIDGILEGRGVRRKSSTSSTTTGRRDFKNFELRVTARYPEKGAGRIEIRHTGADDNMSGYHIAHGVWEDGTPAGSIGRAIESRYGGRIGWDHKAEPLPLDVAQWHTIEITAIKNRITISVNRKPVLDFTDTAGAYTSGGIALICGYNSHVQIKDILIKKLPDEDEQKKPAHANTRRQLADALQPGRSNNSES